jgi:hypothetical protein
MRKMQRHRHAAGCGRVRRFRSVLVAAALSFAAWHADACGPFFPAELLGDRAGTLLNLPEGSFAFEARRLVTPAPNWTVVEHADWLYRVSNDTPVTRDGVEQHWWGDEYERIEKLRDAPSAAAAYTQGKGLPEEARRYLAAAVAWTKDAVDAGKRFRSVLALPPDQRAHYGVWAQYMLGRIAADNEDRDAASAAFRATRDLVAGGAEDPLGLAATSLGDEAKLFLDAGDDARAVALYAEQASAGSEFGRTSLLWVARDMIRDEVRLQRAIADPLTQRLITIYLLTRSGELAESADDVYPARLDAPPANAAAKIERYLAAIERGGLDHVAGADRVAALAYRSGRYDLAGRLADKDASGLSWWLRAKLALRSGDVDGATRAFAQAAQAFPADETWGSELQEESFYFETTRPQCRVEGEQATLALARGEYLAAMEYLYKAASVYWNDAAWIAERVLTLDELKRFVDAHAPPAAPKARKDAAGDDEAPGWGPADTSAALRALLARRYLRADRYDDALAYFDDDGLKAKAQAYVGFRRAAQHGGRIERAQAWFAAANAARDDGLELLGYELDPDFQVYAGGYGWGYEDPAAGAKKSALALPLIGSDEAARTSASAAVPPQRFHYRYDAAHFAERAADLLPPRSQAYAAVLCQGTSWLLNRDPEAARKLYRRYMRNGAYLPWTDSFGVECPAPDFDAAALRWHADRVAHFKNAVRGALPLLAVAAVIVVALIAWTMAARWRRRKA